MKPFRSREEMLDAHELMFGQRWPSFRGPYKNTRAVSAIRPFRTAIRHDSPQRKPSFGRRDPALEEILRAPDCVFPIWIF
jgi:hypothetical protein